MTACPTSGRPYVDKPRLYLDRADFEAQSSNAFMLLGDGVIEGRFDGATHRLAAHGPVRRPQRPDRVHGARLPGRPRPRHVRPARGDADRAPPTGRPCRSQPAAVMATLLAGVTGSLPHIPTAAAGGTRVAPPGHAE